MINIRHISQQVELTFWSIAIESMSIARKIRGRIPPMKMHWRVRKDVALKTLALSGLGMTVGFLIGLILL